MAGMRAAAEPTRLRILALCADGDLTVSELVRILGQSQPRISRHLKVLTAAGLLTRIPEGSWVFHRLAQDGPQTDLAARLVDLAPLDDEVLRRDHERLAQIKRERAEEASDYFRQNAGQWNQVRSLHVDDGEVENAILDMAPASVERHLDLGTGTGRILELLSERTELGQGVDLFDRAVDIGGVGIGHRLYDDRVQAAHRNVADSDRDAHAAGGRPECHRGTGGKLGFLGHVSNSFKFPGTVQGDHAMESQPVMPGNRPQGIGPLRMFCPTPAPGSTVETPNGAR